MRHTSVVLMWAGILAVAAVIVGGIVDAVQVAFFGMRLGHSFASSTLFSLSVAAALILPASSYVAHFYESISRTVLPADAAADKKSFRFWMAALSLGILVWVVLIPATISSAYDNPHSAIEAATVAILYILVLPLSIYSLVMAMIYKRTNARRAASILQLPFLYCTIIVILAGLYMFFESLAHFSV